MTKTRKNYEECKANYLANYPYRVVKYCNNPKDTYSVSVSCGNMIECINHCATCKSIYHDDEWIYFKVEPNNYISFEEWKSRKF